ncbi:cation:proton antiporter [Sphingomonas sp. 8AM]|uniref:cation:proton antiporter n=1 Tax=Sphingomonas sp. 8AM TaxID=2653170 RepID=UPI0012F225B2|nr:cation:proton antiporter [Sphingomonas sp. 8AM]VXC58218.1 Cation/H(+) antiporter [Sphingomonas sp. 8AM]
MAPAQLSVLFFMQLFAIVAVSRAVGWLAKRYLGQPQVVGEMIAGVLLGPSLLGLLAPEWQALLFPKEARGLLYAVAQLGVGLYMFIVGLGFRADHFRSNARSATAVSLSGMMAPFAVALVLAPWLRSIPGLFGPTVTATQAALFTGACIAITAFPMLARIIHERGLSGTPLGTLSLSSGAIDDAGAWTVLAVVLATFGDGAGVAVKAIGGAGLFAIVVLGIGPRLLRPLGARAERTGVVGQTETGIALMLFLLAAFAMDAVGMHAVFGGFLLGVAMPRGAFAEGLKRQLEPITVLLLLPCFFTFSGLNTQLALVADPALLGVTLVVLAASVMAKGGACWAAARLTGQDNATALGVGALMNARGLMELIIINIGLARGIIGPALFSMLVLMAIATTLMTSPLFEFVYGRRARERGELGSLDEEGAAPASQRAIS